MAAPARFVGRRAELDSLEASLSEAKSGRGSVILLSGEVGIGKTRLAGEFLAQSEAECPFIGGGRWYDSVEMPAYAGFLEALLQLCRESEVRAALDFSDPYLKEIPRLGPELADALELGTDSTEVQSVGDQYRLWRGVASLVETAASIRPTVLVLDDLQWADPGSLGLLGFLGRTVSERRILILGLYREEDVPFDHPLGDTIAELARSRALKTMHLKGLRKEEAAQLAASVARTSVSRGSAEVLYLQTEGNPLFVGELVRHLSERSPDALHAKRTASGGFAVPHGLRGVVRKRLDRLSEPCREMLGLVASLGRGCDLSLLERLTDHPRDVLFALLDEAIEAAVLQEGDGGRYAFSHPLLRSVVHESLRASEQIRAHLNVAEAMIDLYGPNAEAHAREIAGHLLAAKGLASPSHVVRFCLAGARQARRVFAFDEAWTLLQGGLVAVDRLAEGDLLRAHLLTELGYAETALGSPDEAIRRYREAIALYGRLGRSQSQLDAQRWLAAALARYGRWAEALQVTRDALNGSAEASGEAYVGLVGTHAMALMVNAAFDEAELWVTRLLDLAFDDSTRGVANHSAACWHTWAAGKDQAGSGAFFAASRDFFLKDGLDSTAAGVCFDHAVTAYFLGRFDESAEAESEAERLAGVTGRLSVLADLAAFRSLRAAHRGDWTAARWERDRCGSLSTEIGGSTVYGQLAERAEALEARFKRGPIGALAHVNASSPLYSQSLRALLYAEAGQAERADELVEPIRQAAPLRSRGLFWLAAVLPGAATMATLGSEELGPWYEALKPYTGCVYDYCAVDVELGRISAGLGQWERAEDHFAKAEALCEERSLDLLLAAALYCHAVVLRRRKQPSDRRRVRELLQRARLLCDELDLDYLRRQVDAILSTPRRGRPHASGLAGLTARERTVLVLLAEGRANREIAQALVLSDRTVARHLESIYAKLGVNNRGAAIAWAHQQNLA